MPVNIRFEGKVAVLSNFGRLLNDPRYVDAAREVRELLAEGYRDFVLDLATLHQLGDVALGLLTTLTRQVRQAGGEAVLANVGRTAGTVLEEMRMDSYWDVFDTVAEAARSFRDRDDPSDPHEAGRAG